MKNNILLFFAFCSIPFISFSQIELYKTYEDFKNNNGVKYEGDIKFISTDKITSLEKAFIQMQNPEQRIRTDSVWGFKYKEVVFRYSKGVLYIPIAVVSVGKIVYYENGPAYVDMLKKNKTKGTYQLGLEGGDFYFSKSLESQAYTTLNRELVPFLKLPEYADLYQCLSKDCSYKFLPKKLKDDENSKNEVLRFYLQQNIKLETVRQCVKDFNK